MTSLEFHRGDFVTRTFCSSLLEEGGRLSAVRGVKLLFVLMDIKVWKCLLDLFFYCIKTNSCGGSGPRVNRT